MCAPLSGEEFWETLGENGHGVKAQLTRAELSFFGAQKETHFSAVDHPTTSD